MKKLLLTIILIGCIFCLGYSTFLLITEKKENNKIKRDIKIVNKKIEGLNKDNSQYKKEIEKIKLENKDKNEELQIWEKAKEKLKKAL